MNRTTMNFETTVCVITKKVRFSFVNIFTGASKRVCKLSKIYGPLA